LPPSGAAAPRPFRRPALRPAVAPVAAPASAPQLVQKRAPGASFEPHSPHSVAFRLAPQDGQNRPFDSLPQFGHFMRPEQ
jgi:hypothetical protein